MARIPHPASRIPHPASRMPDAELERLKAEVSVERMVEDLNAEH